MDDVRNLASALDLAGFGIVGFSQGAPFALACAAAGIATALIEGTSVSLEDLRLVSVSTNRAAFEADRAFYLSDGSAFADPMVQEMVREGEEWKLVVRKD